MKKLSCLLLVLWSVASAAPPVVSKLRATRDKLADEAGGDMRRLFAIVRERTRTARVSGEIVIPEPKRRAMERKKKEGTP